MSQKCVCVDIWSGYIRVWYASYRLNIARRVLNKRRVVHSGDRTSILVSFIDKLLWFVSCNVSQFFYSLNVCFTIFGGCMILVRPLYSIWDPLKYWILLWKCQICHWQLKMQLLIWQPLHFGYHMYTLWKGQSVMSKPIWLTFLEKQASMQDYLGSLAITDFLVVACGL